MKNKPDQAIMVVYYSTPATLFYFKFGNALYKSYSYFMSHKIMLAAINIINCGTVAILQPTKKQ
jgi:hypothetical protein